MEWLTLVRRMCSRISDLRVVLSRSTASSIADFGAAIVSHAVNLVGVIAPP